MIDIENSLYMFKAKVINVVDGDTIDVLLDAGFKITFERRVRLLGVDTPERGQENWKEATNFTKSKLENKDVILQTYKDDSFGRYLAKVYYMQDGEYRSLSDELIENNLIKPGSKWNK